MSQSASTSRSLTMPHNFDALGARLRLTFTPLTHPSISPSAVPTASLCHPSCHIALSDTSTIIIHPAVPFVCLHPPQANWRSVCRHLPVASGISVAALFVAIWQFRSFIYAYRTLICEAFAAVYPPHQVFPLQHFFVAIRHPSFLINR